MQPDLTSEKRIIDKLSENDLYTQILGWLPIFSILYRFVQPSEIAPHVEWLLQKCHEKITHSLLCKELATLFIAATQKADNDFTSGIGAFASDLRTYFAAIGSPEEEKAVEELKFKIIHEKSAPLLPPIVFSFMDEFLDEAQFIIQQVGGKIYKQVQSSCKPTVREDDDGDDATIENDNLNKLKQMEQAREGLYIL